MEPKVVARYADRLDKVGVVGEHDRHLAVAPERVDEQVRGYVDVGTLLLGGQHTNVLCTDRAVCAARTWFGPAHPARAAPELAEEDLNIPALQRTEVHLLSCGLLRIVRARYDPRGEVEDTPDLVVREKGLGERADVKPLTVWETTPQRTVVEVEAIDVDTCLHRDATYLVARRETSPARDCGESLYLSW
ncbi:MAG TPA: hypothetical protein VGY30_12115 [Solirubrobacteraceae bacterium]|nr:hypothetical protein [Solirubrobacteraceae bacterium]